MSIDRDECLDGWVEWREKIEGKGFKKGSLGVVSIVDKIRENILRWCSHVTRRELMEAVRRTVIEMNIEESREDEEEQKRGGWM